MEAPSNPKPGYRVRLLKTVAGTKVVCNYPATYGIVSG